MSAKGAQTKRLPGTRLLQPELRRTCKPDFSLLLALIHPAFALVSDKSPSCWKRVAFSPQSLPRIA